MIMMIMMIIIVMKNNEDKNDMEVNMSEESRDKKGRGSKGKRKEGRKERRKEGKKEGKKERVLSVAKKECGVRKKNKDLICFGRWRGKEKKKY